MIASRSENGSEPVRHTRRSHQPSDAPRSRCSGCWYGRAATRHVQPDGEPERTRVGVGPARLRPGPVAEAGAVPRGGVKRHGPPVVGAGRSGSGGERQRWSVRPPGRGGRLRPGRSVGRRGGDPVRGPRIVRGGLADQADGHALAARSGRQPWHRGNEAPIGLHSEFWLVPPNASVFRTRNPRRINSLLATWQSPVSAACYKL